MILRRKVYINICPVMLRFQDTECQTFFKKSFFRKNLNNTLADFVEIWQCYLW